LRDRHEDIIPLSGFFLRRFAFEARKDVVAFSPEAVAYIAAYSWPGNVRELKNVIERAVILSSGTEILAEDLPRELRRACAGGGARTAGAHVDGSTEGAGPASNPIESAELSLILDALEHSSGNVTAAARLLGITHSTLRYRMKKYGLKPDRGTSASKTA
jgi:two-component system response regulator AtoC